MLCRVALGTQMVKQRINYPEVVGSIPTEVKRRINGDLTEEEFKPLRLMNGLYLQLHAYMLRVAIPYGELSYIQENQPKLFLMRTC